MVILPLVANVTTIGIMLVEVDLRVSRPLFGAGKGILTPIYWYIQARQVTAEVFCLFLLP